MHKCLVDKIKKTIPAFNHEVANGLSYSHLMPVKDGNIVNETVVYAEKIIGINKKLFPSGLRYEGCRICNAYEHFENITLEYKTRRNANIARSDTYLVMLNFSFNGHSLPPKPVLFPFVRPGGLLYLNGGLRSISPILSDVGYSSLGGKLFVHFRRAKLNFDKIGYRFLENDNLVFSYVIWSTIHQKMKDRIDTDRDNRGIVYTSLIHYFFCQFGLVETFKQWGQCDLTIVHRSEANINNRFPKREWVQCESSVLSGNHPSGEYLLMIPRKQYSGFVKSLVAAYFYIVDAFPHLFTELEYITDVSSWRLVLGMIIFGDFEHRGRLTENVDSHLEGLGNYLDELTIEELAVSGIRVKNIWEFMFEIMTTLSHHFYNPEGRGASMYDKRLNILRSVMDEFNTAISLIIYGFQARREKEWDYDSINKHISKFLRINCCISKYASIHKEIATVNYPGDNMVVKVTTNLVLQDSSKKNVSGGKKSSILGDSSRLLDASIAEVGQYRNQPKTAPDGRARLNPYVNITETGLIVRRDEIRKLIDSTQARITER